ncbi:hypothetical protein IDJ75_20360 [Mucilaginibacter rigui]|uniref:Uncharacterized protein n=1 Tax=Mucilaginibacter rigui TaxID=534635 RepID=A0ABR7XBY1_9SPHI|nr:hypothetical protein [Mucilaginibacter rigui]MBD1387650.1 hypothetical protein [Mucilaginibacter rigui]
MQFSSLKYLLVFICIFSILESTGISVVSLLTKNHIAQNNSPIANDDETTPERTETKENKLKELWASELDLKIPYLYISLTKVTYPHKQPTAHLAWVPPVPTPPPNYIG